MILTTVEGEMVVVETDVLKAEHSSKLDFWGWSTFSELMHLSWKPTMTHSSTYSTSLSYLIYCLKIIGTYQVKSSETCSACVFFFFYSWRLVEEDYPESVCFLSLSSVIFWMVQQCAFTEWKMWFGLLRETSCIKRDLSISGQSLQAKCPTRDQEL